MLQIFDSFLCKGRALFGNDTDNTTFDPDGTLKLNGKATTYDDLIMGLYSAKTGGANVPTWGTLVNNINAYTFAVNDFLSSSSELIHTYKQGSPLELHIHWATNGLEAVDKYVKWEIEYSIANKATGAFAASTVVSAETVINANTPSKTHMYTTVGVIDDPALKIGAYIHIRIRRISSSGTAPSANPFGLGIGIHYEIDTLGSRERMTK